MLPLPDVAGRGEQEARVERIAREMRLNAGKDKDLHERLSHRLDKERTKFHQLYNVKEHTHVAPIHER